MNKPPDISPVLISVDLARERDFAIGPLMVRPSIRRVVCGDQERAVQPRVMQVLVALARAKGGVVSREELVETCWDSVIVGDDSITHCIAKVRQLADCGGDQAFEIETIPRVGYRLTQISDSSSAEDNTPRRPPERVSDSASDERWRRLRTRPMVATAGLAAILLLTVALVSFRFLFISNLPPVPSQQALHTTSPVVTLAVLPFANMSGDTAEEFFSDGMTEEVNGTLSNVSGLRVIARRSAFQFKNQNRDVRQIARLLGASHVIEGSIRKDGDNVRVSAQLIRGADGLQLWSKNYDTKLTDIFAIEEQIASSIAAALRVPLGLERGKQLVADRTADFATYEQYLRARALYRSRKVPEAISLLEAVVRRDPNYAPAHSLLALNYSLIHTYVLNEYQFSSLEEGRAQEGAAIDKTEAEARKALRLDSRHSEGYDALALVDAYRMNWISSEDNFRRALALNPDDADALHQYGLLLVAVGRIKDALKSRRKLHEIEPFVPIYSIMTAAMLQMSGEDKAALAMLSATPPGGPTSYFRSIYLARGYAAGGRYAEAADALLAMSPNVKRVSRKSVEDAAGLLRALSLGHALPTKLPLLQTDLGFVYAHTAEPLRVLDAVSHDLDLNFEDLAPFDSIWLPRYAPLWKTAQFSEIIRRSNLVSYWRKRGWADRCRPHGSSGFQCV